MITLRSYLLVTFALFALLTLTVVAAFINVGPLNTPVAMLISAAKAVLIALFFMQLSRQSALVRLFACAGVFWLGLLIVLAMSDYLTR